MSQNSSRTALRVAVIATVVLAACARGPAGPQGETGRTLDDVIWTNGHVADELQLLLDGVAATVSIA